jgi:CDP-glucose 4,6-dehydratase
MHGHPSRQTAVAGSLGSGRSAVVGLNPEVWQGKKIFLTGHTGFKGSWLAQVLQNFGAYVHGYALAPDTQPNHFESLSWQNMTSEIADIRDHVRLTNSLKAAAPEVVFHLAAQPLVLKAYEDPRYTYETNVMGTLNLLEAVRSTPSVRAVVVVTSDKCYENKETTRPYKEDDAMGGYDPYSSSKGCAEILTASYRRSYFSAEDYGKKHNVLLASVRAGNVIGGGDWSENRLIPDFARAFRDNKKVVIRSPEAVRPWQHVLEPIAGYMLLAEKLISGQKQFAKAFNFGPAPEGCWTVRQILEQAKKIWPEFDYTIEDAGRHEAKLLMLDSSLAHNELGWEPRMNVETALKWTMEWYKDFIRGGKVDTSAQIAQYLNL